MKTLSGYLVDLSFYRNNTNSTIRGRYRVKYTPTKEDVAADILKETGNNILKLKNADETLQKETVKFELLLEDTVRVVEEPGITGMNIFRTCVRELTDEEMVFVVNLNAHVKKELNLEETESYFEKHFNFEIGM